MCTLKVIALLAMTIFFAHLAEDNPSAIAMIHTSVFILSVTIMFAVFVRQKNLIRIYFEAPEKRNLAHWSSAISYSIRVDLAFGILFFRCFLFSRI
jgi:hypothetical protein